MAQAIPMIMQTAGTAGGTVAKVQEADLTAKSLQSEARSIEAQAAFDETQQRRKNRLLLGEANAQAAASGIQVTSGSPLLLELDRVKQAEIEALSIRRAGSIQAEGRRYGARLARRSIPYTILGGILQGGSSFMKGMPAGGGGSSGGSGSTSALGSTGGAT